MEAVGVVDSGLEVEEGGLGGGFGGVIAGDGYIDYTTRRDGRGQQNGWEFNLRGC